MTSDYEAGLTAGLVGTEVPSDLNLNDARDAQWYAGYLAGVQSNQDLADKVAVG